MRLFLSSLYSILDTDPQQLSLKPTLVSWAACGTVSLVHLHTSLSSSAWLFRLLFLGFSPQAQLPEHSILLPDVLIDQCGTHSRRPVQHQSAKRAEHEADHSGAIMKIHTSSLALELGSPRMLPTMRSPIDRIGLIEHPVIGSSTQCAQYTCGKSTKW